MRINALPIAERALASALALGPALVTRARNNRSPWIAASVVRGPAIVLGAMQRAGRVVELAACADAGVTVMRRATTGTAVNLGERAILWTLVLPHIAALAPDTTPRTLLNRNVRGFLEGFKQAGAAAHYFGREWIAIRQRPGVVLGYDVDEDGVVLLELLATWDGAIDLPAHLAAPVERALDRYAGKATVGLGEIFDDKTPSLVAEIVASRIASRAAAEIEWTAIEEPDPLAPVTSALDPIPNGFEVAPSIRVPIGWIDVATSPDEAPWLGGDVLVSRAMLRDIARRVASSADLTDLATGPIDGARSADLVAAARSPQLISE